MSMASKVLSSSQTNLLEAAERLRNGELVAFPTETVYGLGGAISSELALKKIFAVKGRPLHDPLIIHVTSQEMCLPYLSLSTSEMMLFDVLAEKFWPGPLTVVLPASDSLSRLVTAGGNTVGVRYPAHPVAQEIIRASGVPIAAPSANRFGHVSPTSAKHVEADLGDADIWIIDGGECAVGIESTVVKLWGVESVEILRPGAVTEDNLRRALEPMGVAVVRRNRVYTPDGLNMESPGQLLKHYAPKVNAYILQTAEASRSESLKEVGNLVGAGLIDFGGRWKIHAKGCGAYVDLSESANLEEACKRLFETLRQLENNDEIHFILMPDLSHREETLSHALFDRIERACSLRIAWIRGCSVLTDV